MLKFIAPGLLLVYFGTQVYVRAQVLPPTENCATVYCAPLQCSNQYKPPGSCCPVCQSIGSDTQSYDSPDMQGPDERYRPLVGPGPEPYPQPPGGGILPPNCASVPCAQPACSNPYIPPGGCCAVCQQDGPGDTPSLPPGGGVLPINCASVQCPQPACPNSYIPPGSCCAVCPQDGPGDTPSLPPGGPGPQPHDIPDALGPDDIYRLPGGPGPEPYPPPPVGPGPEPYPQPPGGPVGPDPSQQSGGLRCQNMQCSPLRCREQYTPPGLCCPVCTGDPTGQY